MTQSKDVNDRSTANTYAEEKAARENAERLLEGKASELYSVNQMLEEKDQALQQATLQIRKLTQQLDDVQEELKKRTRYDSLTDLPNHMQFEEILKRELARAVRYNRKLALFYVDIDFFKKMNDNFGREIGDLFLQEAASRLRHLLRIEDSAARVGDDEFAVLITEIEHPRDAEIVAQRIMEKMLEPYQVAGHSIILSVSIGIACFPEAGSQAEMLQHNAELALHKAKGLGRKNYQFFINGVN